MKRKRLTELMQLKYDAITHIDKTELATIQHIILTTDIWTDKYTTKSFLGVTAHYIRESCTHLISN